jgi:hypothetical protein
MTMVDVNSGVKTKKYSQQFKSLLYSAWPSQLESDVRLWQQITKNCNQLFLA